MTEPIDLLVASSGGHLKELTRLRPRLGQLASLVWATPHSAQGQSLLAGEDVIWLPYVRPHDLLGVARASLALSRELRGRRVGRVISTGASPAISALPTAVRHRAEVHYIESVARVSEPSATGRIMRHVPGAHCYAQYDSWTDKGWHFAGSVFDDFEVAQVGRPLVRTVVVTLGLNETYGFGRLLRALLGALPPEVEVLWQVGATDAALLPATSNVVASLPAHELRDAMSAADLVICHAGTGSALTALEAGHLPVLVPRQQKHGEHIDDHQVQIATELHKLGLAQHTTVEDIAANWFNGPLGGWVTERLAPPLDLLARSRSGR